MKQHLKGTLLVLAAISATVLALPAMASAAVPLHVTTNPGANNTVTGGTATLSTSNGTTVHCNTFGGNASFANSTEGTLTLQFGPTCESGGFHCNSAGKTGGTIVTEPLPFQLATLSDEKPGILVSPNATTLRFAHFVCAGFITIEVKGNGVLGRIEKNCGDTDTSAGIDFNATAHGVQEYTTLKNTTSTTYQLKKGAENAAQDATGTVNFGVNRTLQCT